MAAEINLERIRSLILRIIIEVTDITLITPQEHDTVY